MRSTGPLVPRWPGAARPVDGGHAVKVELYGPRNVYVGGVTLRDNTPLPTLLVTAGPCERYFRRVAYARYDEVPAAELAVVNYHLIDWHN